MLETILVLGSVLNAIDEAITEVTTEAAKNKPKNAKNDLPKRPTAEEARAPHPDVINRRKDGTVPKLSELIKTVSVNDDFVVIRWADETVMHVKKHKDEPAFDIEKAIAMATLKYLFGSKYYSDFVEVVAKTKYCTTTEEADIPSGMPTNSSDAVAVAPATPVGSANKSANKVKKTATKANTTRAKSSTKATKNTKTENKTSTTKTTKTTKSGKTTKGSKTTKNTKSSKK